MCVVAAGFLGLTSFLQIHSVFQKYIQQGASSSRSLLPPPLSSRCLKQPRWSRCCVTAQPRVSRSQHMIRSKKPEKQRREKSPAVNLKVKLQRPLTVVIKRQSILAHSFLFYMLPICSNFSVYFRQTTARGPYETG